MNDNPTPPEQLIADAAACGRKHCNADGSRCEAVEIGYLQQAYRLLYADFRRVQQAARKK